MAMMTGHTDLEASKLLKLLGFPQDHFPQEAWWRYPTRDGEWSPWQRIWALCPQDGDTEWYAAPYLLTDDATGVLGWLETQGVVFRMGYMHQRGGSSRLWSLEGMDTGAFDSAHDLIMAVLRRMAAERGVNVAEGDDRHA